MVKQVSTVERNGKTYAQILVCNTKQSTWRANTVSLVSTNAGDIELRYTFTEDIDYLENVMIEVEIQNIGKLALRFEIEGVEFGPLYQNTLN